MPIRSGPLIPLSSSTGSKSLVAMCSLLAGVNPEKYGPAYTGGLLGPVPTSRTFIPKKFTSLGCRYAVIFASSPKVPGAGTGGDPTVVLGGDVLFAGGVGRSDFPRGSHRQLIDGIRAKLYTLPPDTKVFPGHGPPTTIAAEQSDNPFTGRHG